MARMEVHMRKLSTLLVAALACSGVALAKPPADKPHTAHETGTPPGLAKKGGVPPGLAKHFGTSMPATAYIAIDPRHDDRAWFLIDDRWVLRQHFDPGVRAEVRSLFPLPPLPHPPPVPLPKLDAPLRVLRFG
jgi:hypothetical protein